MNRALLIIAIAAAGLGCVKDRSCRNNTVLVQVEFADGHDRVDGVALKVALDDAPMVELKPIDRPPGVDHDGLELAVQNYASHKKLTLQYAPSKAGTVVGPWQEKVVEIQPGCTTIDLIIALGADAGLVDAPTIDGLLTVDAQPDATIDGRPIIDVQVDRSLDGQRDATPVDTSVDALSSGDGAPDVPLVMPEVGDDTASEVDVPADSARDAPIESAASVDLPMVAPTLDAAADMARNFVSDTVPDLVLDTAPEVSSAAGSDAAFDGSADVGQPGCLIDSTAYASGVANPANYCQTCQPGQSGSTWTDVSNGTGCGSGQLCNAGICRLGCWLDGSYYPAAAAKPGNACQYCNPTLSVGEWTKENNGTGCGSGQVCHAGLCGTGCWIGSTFYASGAVNPVNACQTCQPGTADTAWTNSTDGTNCGTGQICSSVACQSGCWIGNTVYTSGAVKPGNPCQTCQPEVSVTAWTNANSTNCPVGQVCNAGACKAGCWIGGTYYVTDAKNPGNGCQSCQPNSSTTGWRNVADGAACGSGGVCYSATCGDCVPGRSRCKDTSMQQHCSGSGTWQNPVSCSAGTECVGDGDCLKSNGQACTSTGECATGACTTFYVDADGDGYAGSSSTERCGTTPPSGYISSSLGVDCCDTDANTHPVQTTYPPAQTGYFPVPNNCLSFDYDCNGYEELWSAFHYGCAYVLPGGGTAAGSWAGYPPGCGSSGSWCPCGGGSCIVPPAPTVQTCR